MCGINFTTKIKSVFKCLCKCLTAGALTFLGFGDCNTSEPSTCGLDPHPELQKAMANHYCIILFCFSFLLSFFFNLENSMINVPK